MNTQTISILLLVLLLLTAMIAGYQWFVQRRESAAAAQGFREIQTLVTQPTELQEQAAEEEPVPMETTAPRTAYETYHGLLLANPDFIGWLRIEGTAVDYPVMYAPNRPDFYLRRNFYGKASNHGVPYLEEGCAPGMSNNLIIYGHNMKDGSMLHDVLNYRDRDFWEDHQTISFDTLNGFGTYQVMLAFLYDAEWDTFKYHTFTDMDEIDFEAFLEECQKRSLYDTGITAEYGDELLTISTCEYSHANGRFVLVAKRVREED